MFDIITFGSAARDVFLRLGKFKVVEQKEFATGKGICFPLGSKVDVKDIDFYTGGGGTNTAAAFAKQGFKTAFFGMVGKDFNGQEIIQELEKIGVDSQFILRTSKRHTNYSVIFSNPQEDRTILVYRGASELLLKKDIPWQKLKSKWFYLAPLSGVACEIFESVVNFAKDNNIKIAANPGNSQLSLPREKLERILKKIDILILNQEEASFLTKIPYSKEGEIFKKIDELCPGVAIMTKGPGGVVVSDGKYLYTAKPLKTKVIDRTGAGDSFASGFVSGFIKSNNNISYAIQLGMANSAACLLQWGAKTGLLEKDDKFKKVAVQKQLCIKK